MFKNLPTIHIRLPERGGNILHLNPMLAQATLPAIGGSSPGLVFPGAHELSMHKLVWHVVNVAWAQSPLSNSDKLEERILNSLANIGFNAEYLATTVDGFGQRDLYFEADTAGCKYLDRFMLWQGDYALRQHLHAQVHWMRLSNYYLSADLTTFDDKRLKEYREFARDIAKEVEQANERHIRVLSAKAAYDHTLRHLGAVSEEEQEVAEELEALHDAPPTPAEDTTLEDEFDNELEETED